MSLLLPIKTTLIKLHVFLVSCCVLCCVVLCCVCCVALRCVVLCSLHFLLICVVNTVFTFRVYSCFRFSDEARVEIPFTSDLEPFKIDVDFVENMRGDSFINKGLVALGQEYERHGNPNKPKVRKLSTFQVLARVYPKVNKSQKPVNCQPRL